MLRGWGTGWYLGEEAREEEGGERVGVIHRRREVGGNSEHKDMGQVLHQCLGSRAKRRGRHSPDTYIPFCTAPWNLASARWWDGTRNVPCGILWSTVPPSSDSLQWSESTWGESAQRVWVSTKGSAPEGLETPRLSGYGVSQEWWSSILPWKSLSGRGEGALGPWRCWRCRSRVGHKAEGLSVDRVLTCNK